MWSRSGRRRLALALALSLMLPAASAAQTTVVSQNCLHLGWGQKTASKVAGIYAASNKVNADVMVLQEVMPKGGAQALADIVVKFGGPGTYTSVVGPAHGKGSYREFYGFIARNTFVMGGVTSTTNAAGVFARPPDGVTIAPPSGKAQFWAINYHAVFGKNIGIRQTEVRQMAAVAAAFNKVKALATVIGGDWNLPTTDGAFTPLTGAGYTVNPNVLTSLNPQGVRSSAYDHFAWNAAAAVANEQLLPPLMTDASWRTNVSDHLGIQCRVP
jgi:hypothetical protein